MLLNIKAPFLKKLAIGAVFGFSVAAAANGFLYIFSRNDLCSVHTIFVFSSTPVLIYIIDTILFYFIKPPNLVVGGQENAVKNVKLEA